MANIIRRREQMQAPDVFDPMRMMRDLLGFDPFAQMTQMAPLVGRGGELGFVPDFEVKETKDAYIFKADLPGVDEKDLDITLTGNRLTVSGKREAEKREENDRYFALERSYGSFTRSFTLPEGVDGDRVEADLKNGVLTLSVPKAPEHQPKKIDLKPQQQLPEKKEKPKA